MITVGKEYGWGLNLQGYGGETGFFGIQQANVVDGIILILNLDSRLHGAEAKQYWHVIIPGKHIETGFLYHSEYLNYLKTLGFNSEPKLQKIDDVANYFDDHDEMDWEEFNRKQVK
jgi:hypothetical protein